MKKYTFADGLINAWFVDTNEHIASLSDYLDILDDQEQQKANRFKFAKDRNCFIVSHGVLRTLLAERLGVGPREIQYTYNKYEKPFLKKNPQELQFNLSHSYGRAVIAFVKKYDIGVDIEYMKRNIEMSSLVGRFFSDSEREEYSNLPEGQKTQGFYNCWTRKEAFIKALGLGLYHSLKNFSVSLTPNTEAKVLSVDESTEEALKWQLYGFAPEEDLCAAIAIK